LAAASEQIVRAECARSWPGFWIKDSVLSDRECDDLIEAVSQSLQGRSRAGARHLMSTPAVEAVLSDDEILDLARTQEKVECMVPRGGVLAMRPLPES